MKYEITDSMVTELEERLSRGKQTRNRLFRTVTEIILENYPNITDKDGSVVGQELLNKLKEKIEGKI